MTGQRNECLDSKAGGGAVAAGGGGAVIAGTKLSSPVRRGDAVLMQVNVFLTMLCLAVGFYYMKSLRCHDELQRHLACPVAVAGTNIRCMGCVMVTVTAVLEPLLCIQNPCCTWCAIVSQ